MTATLDNWRLDPGRWSQRLIKSKKKDVVEHLRRTKSVEEPKFSLEVISEDQPETPDDGYVEDDSPIIEENITDDQCCVLCVGSTGTGKSFTISTMTGLPVASNAGADSVTKRCALYRPMTKLRDQTSTQFSWIDTVGWDDAECDDEETFREILKFIDANYLTSIKAILWHVLPNVRKDALLTRQARLINQFTDNSEIWSNVIIVCKQAMNPDDDSRGPVRVAVDYNTHSKLQVVGYRCMDDPTISDRQRKAFENEDVRAAFNVLKREEIRNVLSEKLDNIEKPFKVVFHDSYCVDCAEQGDVRLMSSFCHMAPHMAHSGRLRNTHPKELEFYHSNPITVSVHEGALKTSQINSMVDRLLNRKRGRGKRYACCNQRPGMPGCIRRWACCRQICDASTAGSGCKRRYACCLADYTENPQGCEQRYACCERLVDEEGCQKLCRKCDRPWGSEPRGCFKKAHNVRRLSTYGKDPEDQIQKIGEESQTISTETDKEKRHSRFIYDFELPPVIIYHVF